MTRSSRYIKRSPDDEPPLSFSIAADTVFVVEIRTSGGNHRASLLIEMSRCQYYDIRRSNRNPHFHLLGKLQTKPYLQRLEKAGYERVIHGNMWLPRPKNYYILLLREFDYYLDEVTVLNNIHRNNLLNGVVNKIPFSWMAQSMFVDSDNKQSGRGNILWDAGFTGLNSTDASIVPGLNLPGRILKTKHQR